MKKSIIALILLLSTGIAFSQTTVTLQDQCNCEVLKGTAVSSPGAVTPNGVDTGDIYVNTNTGTIYFWDGDSWELTSSDNQQLTGFNFDGATNTLTLNLENGGSVNVDLSSLSDTLTDTNTTITSFGIDGTNTNLVITDSDTNTYAVALADIAALIDTDDQALSLTAGNILTLEDGGTVDLTPYLDNTDDQAITAFSLDNATNILTLTLEDGGTQTVDFSTVLAAAGTDDQALSLAAGNILTLEDGGTVDLTPYLDNTDDQAITAFSLDNATNVLTLTLEDGGTQTVDLSALDNSGSDDQTLTLSGNSLSIEDGNNVDLSGYLDNTDGQTLSLSGSDLSISGGNTVDISSIDTDTDDQTLTLSGNTLSIADGNSVDLSALDNSGSDDQTLTLSGNSLSIEDGNNVDLSGYLDNTD
ncbi:hypothetical protein AB1A65_09100, partial [Muricauda sp. ANG21]|uniref:hypothetical protein n=1 Tax=Allomuricauda sp. ANG21 TaxID=3042468 RepID=UPI0034516550